MVEALAVGPQESRCVSMCLGKGGNAPKVNYRMSESLKWAQAGHKRGPS